MAALFVVAILSLLQIVTARFAPADRFPSIPAYGPLPNADYMVDNQHNYFKTAPDKGKVNGAVWAYSGSFENYMAKLRSGQITRNNGTDSNSTQGLNFTSSSVQMIDGHRSGTLNDTFALETRSAGIEKRDGSYWLPTLAPKGIQPIAGSGYKFYRNVMDYGADKTGGSDTVEAINAAIQDGNRCGLECGNTFTTGALIYFPPGKYKVCSPIIQLYYTQFVGDALDPPTIVGCDSFKGIALMDTDPYIPGGNGANWYINQNQFFRQIRNFIFDLRSMPSSTAENDQPLVPTGLHWQVSQACSLQNLVFNMPTATDSKNTTHVGIFMENGSGGFVSDLTFNGGNIGWRAGSQQYTAINIKFKGCLTAVQMVWDWGFNWQRVDIDGSAIGFNISGRGGDTGQGIGSVSIIDSTIANTPIGVLTNSRTDGASPPNIVLDNVVMNNVGTPIADDKSKVILGTGGNIGLWATGKRYNGGKGTVQTGAVTAPKKATRLLDSSGKLFYRARPQYENLGTSSFLVATDNGCKNDGTGDNTNAINAFLKKAQAAGQVAYFPAGIYIVGGTVVIPTGSKVQGAAWSQIQGSGFYFNDINNPHVMVQVGNKGDVGSMEIVDMMFTVRGATAGAIVLEWNVHESTQGSAAMWDTHVRVGGADGTDLDLATCPKLSGLNDRCICASLLFHVTKQASGYFENVWIWLADHDNDASLYDSPDKMSNQVSLYAARGTLIESEGPSWFYGTGSEHTIMYQYQLFGAKDVYLGHIQTETPYYQPNPVAPYPFDGQVGQNRFPGDPDFSTCKKDDVHCQEAWGLRIINSKGITLHSAGLYSFFDEYYQDCIETQSCQDRIAEVKGSTDVVIFNLFTIASEQIGTGINNEHINQNDSNQSGFTTEISVWLPSNGDDILDVVYVGTEVWASPSATCSAPCVMVFPTSKLSSSTTISPPPYTTSFEYGNGGTTVANGQTVTTFFTTTITVTINIPPITVGGMPYSNYNVTQGQTGTPIVVRPSVDIPPIGVPLPDGSGKTTTRTVTLPPWPDVTRGPPDGSGWGNPTGGISGSTEGVYHTPFTTTVSATKATVTTLSFPATVSPITVTCPPQTTIAFATPKTTITTQCDAATVYTLGFTCPGTRVVTFLGPSAGVFTADCTLSTVFNSGVTSVPGGTAPPGGTPPTTTPTTTTPLPVWTTWPPGAIIPVTTTVDQPKPTDDGVITPCHLWFFDICIVRNDIRVLGWHWVLPPGIYPPGPPPGFIQFPPGWTTIGPLPPWPKITIGNDHQITYEKSSTECETRTASVCSTTTQFSATITGTTTRTTATVTASACETISGCNVRDSNTATATATVTGCPAPSRLVRRDEDDDEGSLARRQASSSDCGANAIVYPKDPSNVGQIPSLLSAYSGKYFEDKSVAGGYTSFWWVPTLDRDTFGKLQASSDVSSVYYYEEYNRNIGPLADDEDPGDDGSEEIVESEERFVNPVDSFADIMLAPEKDTLLYHDNKLPSAPEIQNGTDELQLRGEVGLLDKRAVVTQGSVYWDLPMDSLPRGSIYQATADSFVNGPDPWKYSYDETAGSGQYVYLINEEGIWTNHDEFTKTQGTIETLGTVNFGAYPNSAAPNPKHGSGCGAKILGAKLGVCKKCTMVVVPKEADMSKLPNFNVQVKEKIIQQLNAVLDDIIAKNRVGKASISMSFSYNPGKKTPAFYQAMRYSLNQLVVKGKAVLVAASCNHAKSEGRAINRFPALYGSPDTTKNTYGKIDTLITVGAVDQDTYEGSFSQYADWMTTYGPGANVYVPADPSGGTNAMRKGSGTSFACPQVAALVGYLRALPSKWQTQLQEPANVKKLIRVLHRRFAVKNPINYPEDNSKRKPVIWNGQVGSKSCLIDYDTKSTWDTGGRCPTIPDDLSTLPEDPGETVATCANPVLVIPKHKRQSGAPGSCPAAPGGGGGDSGGGQTISITTGATASPTCASGTGCGGHLCTGYYCKPSPTGVPPGFQDPKDPSAGNTVSSTTITDKPTGTTAQPTTTAAPTTTGRGTAPPAASPTAYLDIAFGSEYTEGGIYPELGWFFWYQPWSQQTKDACKWTNSFNLPGTYDESNPNYPDGSFRLVADQPNGCYYIGTRQKPGILSCPDLSSDIQCATVTYDGGTCYLDNGPLVMDPKVRCQWGSAAG